MKTQKAKKVKKQYSSPKLTNFGSVAELTFGVSSSNMGM